jgi:hypothetical protein
MLGVSYAWPAGSTADAITGASSLSIFETVTGSSKLWLMLLSRQRHMQR